MEARIRVCEDGIELEFGLEEVEFGGGQDGPVCGSVIWYRDRKKSAYHDRLEKSTTDKRSRMPTCFQESREP